EAMSRRTEAIQRGDQVVKICQTLTHSHNHDVGDCLVPREKVSQLQYLLEDLVGGQIPLESFESAGTKYAAHSAPNLGAQAGCLARTVGHQNALNSLAVPAFEKQFTGVIECNAMMDRSGAEDRPLGIELLAQLLGQV